MPLSSKLWKQLPVEKVRQYQVPEPVELADCLPDAPVAEEPAAPVVEERVPAEPPREEAAAPVVEDLEAYRAAREEAWRSREKRLAKREEQLRHKEAELNAQREKLRQYEDELQRRREAEAAAFARRQQEEMEKVYLEGFNRGYRDGLQKVKQEQEALLVRARQELETAQRILADAKRQAMETVARAETQIVELAMSVADKLLRGQLKSFPETVVGIVREAVAALPEGAEIKIFVHPEDKVLCKDLLAEIQSSSPGITALELVADSAITRGSCRVESEKGSVTVSLDEEFRRLREMLVALSLKEQQRILAGGGGARGGHH